MTAEGSSDVRHTETTYDDVFIEGSGKSASTSLPKELPQFEKVDGEIKFVRHTYNCYKLGDMPDVQEVQVGGDDGWKHAVTEQHKIRWFFCL